MIRSKFAFCNVAKQPVRLKVRQHYNEVFKSEQYTLINVGCTIVVNRPVREVFEFVTNPENDNVWVAFSREVRKLSPGPICVGTRFRQRGAVMGLQVPVVWEITEFERYRRMAAATLTGPAAFKGQYTFEAVPGGTQLVKSGQIEFDGLLRLIEPVLGGLFQNALQGDMNRLKMLMEQPVTRPGAPPLAGLAGRPG